MAGAFNQFATGIGNTDAGFVMGTGKLLIKGIMRPDDAEKAIANQTAAFEYSIAATQLAEAAAQLRALRQMRK